MLWDWMRISRLQKALFWKLSNPINCLMECFTLILWLCTIRSHSWFPTPMIQWHQLSWCCSCLLCCCVCLFMFMFVGDDLAKACNEIKYKTCFSNKLNKDNDQRNTEPNWTPTGWRSLGSNQKKKQMNCCQTWEDFSACSSTCQFGRCLRSFTSLP